MAKEDINNDKEKLKALSEELAAAKQLKLSKEEKLRIELQITDVMQERAKKDLIQAKSQRKSTEEFEAAYNKFAKKREKKENDLDKIYENRRKKQEQDRKAKKKEKQAAADQKKAQEDILDIIGSIGDRYQKGFIGKVLDSKVTFDQIKKKIKETFTFDTFKNMGIAMLRDATLMTVKDALGATAALSRLTGQGNRYNESLMAAKTRNTEFGASLSSTGAAIGSLFTGMSSFSQMTGETRAAVEDAAIQLSNMGIAGEQSAFMMEFAKRTMGKTGKEAAASAQGLADFASSIGVAPAKLAADFQASAPRIAAYGKTAMKVFESLSLKSKQLGIDLNSLLDVTDQFDTFEGAADAAGKLNQALGGQFLDSTKMLTAATKEDQIAMIQSAMIRSGKTFESLSRIEQKYVAGTLGITDMTVANNLLGSQSIKTAAQMEREAVSEAQRTKNRQAGIDITQKMTATMQSLAVAVMPIVEGLSAMATKLAQFVQWAGKFATVPLAILGFFAAVKVGALIIGGIITMVGTLSSVSAFFGLTAASTAPAAAGLGLSLSGLGTAAIAAAPGIGMLALAALGVGAAFALAGLGVWLIVNGFTSLLSMVIENKEHMGDVLTIMVKLAGTFALVGAGLLLAAAGFWALSLSVGAFLVALPAIGGAGLILGGLSLAVGALGLAFFLAGGSIKEVADSITAMVNSIGEMSEINGFTKFINVVEKIDDAQTSGLEDVIDQAERFVEIQAKMSNAAMADSLGNAVDKLTNLVFGKEESSEQPKREIVLKLDNFEFGRAVVQTLREDMLLSI